MILDLSINHGGYIYLPKEVREALGTELGALPNHRVMLVFSKDLDVGEILARLRLIKQDLELQRAS